MNAAGQGAQDSPVRTRYTHPEMDAFADPSQPDEAADAASPLGPDLAVRVTGEASGFVAAALTAGRYPNAEAVVADALALLEEETLAEPWKEARFDQLIQQGLDQIDRGEVIHVTDLKAFFDELEAEVQATAR